MNQDATGWWHLDPSSRLATMDVSRKLVGAVPPFWGEGLVPM